MSKDIKEVINTVEKKSKTTAELEQKIQSLEEEINRHKFTIKEQEHLIKNLQNQLENGELENSELPSEINVLKELIISQRQELDNKTIIIEELKDKNYKLTSGFDEEDSISKNITSEEILETEKLLLKITEENENYKEKIKLLEFQIGELQLEKSEVENAIEDNIITELNEELVNFKRLNFQLMEENGLLRVEVESLKTKLNEKLEKEEVKELKLANNKITVLMSEIKDLEAQIEYLQEKVDKTDEPVIVSTEDALEFAKLRDKFHNTKAELLKIQKENQNLKQVINELKEEKISVKQVKDVELLEVKNLSKPLNQSLFFRMYSLLDDLKKEKVINYLIQDLKSKNYQLKRNAIKILSILKNEKIYNAFLERLDDKDWITRYSLLKALSKFEDKNDELKKIFQRFSTDDDVDVREFALKFLEDFPN